MTNVKHLKTQFESMYDFLEEHPFAEIVPLEADLLDDIEDALCELQELQEFKAEYDKKEESTNLDYENDMMISEVWNRLNEGHYDIDKNHNSYDCFRRDTFKALGIEDNPKRDKLLSLAWQEGHSSGYSEVWNYMLEMVDLIR